MAQIIHGCSALQNHEYFGLVNLKAFFYTSPLWNWYAFWNRVSCISAQFCSKQIHDIAVHNKCHLTIIDYVNLYTSNTVVKEAYLFIQCICMLSKLVLCAPPFNSQDQDGTKFPESKWSQLSRIKIPRINMEPNTRVDLLGQTSHNSFLKGWTN